MSESLADFPTDHTPASLAGLNERIRSRMAAGDSATDKKGRRKANQRPTLASLEQDRTAPRPGSKRHAKLLLTVYRELQGIYRAHRASTGQPSNPALRAAVVNFQKEPSLESLTLVAAFLEDRRLLAW